MRPCSRAKQQRKTESKILLHWQLSYALKTKSRTDYGRSENLKTTCQQVAAFKAFRKLNHKWVDLAIENARLKPKNS